MAGRALILSAEQEAKIRQDIVDSAHRTFDARSYGERNFPVFLQECLEKRVWEQERRFESGGTQAPISFEDFIRKPYPVGLGTSFPAVERVVAGRPALEELWRQVTGRGVELAIPESLDELEQMIGDGLRTFVEVGLALARIRDAKLYKAPGHKTFEVYCEKRWGFSRKRAYELMEAAAVVENVRNSGRGSLEPRNASQATELARLPAEQQAPAWEEAVRTAPNGKVTARHVAEVVESRIPEPEPASSARAAERPPEPQRQVKLSAIDRAMGIVRNMSETDVYAFKLKFNEYLKERALAKGRGEEQPE